MQDIQFPTLQYNNRALNDRMVVYNQDELDAAFADMDTLLSANRGDPVHFPNRCINCGRSEFVYNGPCHGHPGSRICNTCGVVERGCVFWETMYGKGLPVTSSNYKRIHHWHERISQLILSESQIPPVDMYKIGQKLCDGSYSVVNKDNIRAVLRSLKMQKYIEKWLQIVYRITGIAPPSPGPMMLNQLDSLFHDLQRPFESNCISKRKNFLNYNYVFCRLLQKMDCTKFCSFFPLIKSKEKLKVLDGMWTKMCDSIGWEVKELKHVPPFAVRLEQPAALLQSLGLRCDAQALVVPEKEQTRTGFRESDHRPANTKKRSREQLHSGQPEPELQKLGLVKRRLR